MSLPRPADDAEPSEHYDEADPAIHPAFRSLRKVNQDDGNTNLYDPDDPDRRWILYISEDELPYLSESI